MTREEIYSACETALTKSNVLLLEAATGFGKTWVSIKLVNWITAAVYKDRKPKMLLLVAKRVHKQTWKDEFDKWGGVNADVVMECYESLHKHTSEYFDFIVMDECHHIGSEVRIEALKTIKYGYIIGLSATIPLKIKQWFKYNYHSEVVSCDIIEAIDSEVLPEPTILLFPLQIENTRQSETIEINPKVKGPVYHGEYKDLWKYKKAKQHAILKCTQKQKLMELDKLIEWYKKKAMMGNQAMKQTWLYFCGKRLEFLADCKLQWVKLILHHLDKERTITFCKTIAQTEQLGKNCIHSQNKDATKVYDNFNNKKINHITAVNILNENANLVDCRYGIFCNITSSEIITQQRQGRLLRHKDPIMVIPYYVGTREEELVKKGIEGFKSVKTIHSISEI
jgi:superfamily II DNA or RNA helicase